MIATLLAALLLAAPAAAPAPRPAAAAKPAAATPAAAPKAQPAPAPVAPPPAAAAQAAPAPRRPAVPRLAVLDVVLTGRDAQGLDAAALTELLAGAVEDPETYRMTTARDLSAMLGLERMKQMAGCTEDTSCLAEIAGSLGVDFLVSASVGSLEGRLVVSGRLVDVKRAAVMGRSSETVAARADAGEALQRVGRRLRNGFRAGRGLAPVAEPAPAAPPPAAGPALAWGGWLGAAAAPGESTVGGEALLTLDAGAWEVAAGATIAGKPAARLAISRALGGRDLSFRLGVKGLAGSATGGSVVGGGPAAWLRWRLAGWLDADLVASAEYLTSPAESKLVPVVALGLHAHGGP